MDRWVDICIDEWTCVQMGGQVDRSVNAATEGQTHRVKNRRVDGRAGITTSLTR